METIICAIVGAFSTIAVAVVSALSVRSQKKIEKSQKEIEKRESRRKEESLLSLALISANLALSEATANACLNRVNNGNVERAYAEASAAKKAYVDFERRIISEEI